MGYFKSKFRPEDEPKTWSVLTAKLVYWFMPSPCLNELLVNAIYHMPNRLPSLHKPSMSASWKLELPWTFVSPFFFFQKMLVISGLYISAGSYECGCPKHYQMKKNIKVLRNASATRNDTTVPCTCSLALAAEGVRDRCHLAEVVVQWTATPHVSTKPFVLATLSPDILS